MFFKVGAPNTNLCLVRIFPQSDWIRNVGKYGPEKTPYLDTFHAAENILFLQYFYLQYLWALVLETPRQMFSCEYCNIFKNSFSYRARQVTASESLKWALNIQSKKKKRKREIQPYFTEQLMSICIYLIEVFTWLLFHQTEAV